jgi:hypothetical protein
LVKDRIGKGVEAAKKFERHAESIANGLSKETMTHFMNAGMNFAQAANAAMKAREIPDETRLRMHKAQKEMLLAMKSAIEVVLAEIDKEMPSSEKHELKKIVVKKRTSR